MARASSKQKSTTTILSKMKFQESFHVREEEEEDLLEPQFYPDAAVFKTSLEGLSEDEELFKKNLTSNKATLQALAPYLRILHKDQRRKIESAKYKSKSAVVTTTKKSKDHIVGVVPELSQDPELVSSIVETGTTLKSLLKAGKVFIYLVDRAINKLYCTPNEDWKGKSRVTLKIKEGQTMAACAAFRKDIIISRNLWSDPRFPLGLVIPDSLAKFGLGVPIKTPDDDLVAVYEFTRDRLSAPFDKKDVQTVLAITGWVGAGELVCKKQCISTFKGNMR